MKVSLVDVDGRNFPNLALMKLSAWHKAQGDTVDWYIPLFSRPDRIYASKVFTFTPDYNDYSPNDPNPRLGGTGYKIYDTLPYYIENTLQDYSIYPKFKYAYGFLSRGCIRNCKWCVVPRKEGSIKTVDDIEKISQGRKNIVLMDNNFLANNEEFIQEQLEKAQKNNFKIDFNQALDARLVTQKNALLLAKTKWIRYIRFSCDTDNVMQNVKNAINLIKKNGYKGEFFIYVLAQDVDSTLNRINFLSSMYRVTPFVMPYRNLDGDGQIANNELKRLARWCNI